MENLKVFFFNLVDCLLRNCLAKKIFLYLIWINVECGVDYLFFFLLYFEMDYILGKKKKNLKFILLFDLEHN